MLPTPGGPRPAGSHDARPPGLPRRRSRVLLVEAVDTEAHMRRLEAIVEEMVEEGLVTLEKVRVIKYAPGKRAPEGGGA